MQLVYILIAAVMSGIITQLLRYLDPKSRFVIWRVSSYEYNLPNLQGDATIPVFVQTMRIDNLGRFPIEDIQILHRMRPDFYAFDPPQPHQETVLQSGEHLISMNSLAPHTGFALQYFCYARYPELVYVRSKQGQAEAVPVKPQIIVPKWQAWFLGAVLFIGLSTLIFGLIRLTLFLVGHPGQ